MTCRPITAFDSELEEGKRQASESWIMYMIPKAAQPKEQKEKKKLLHNLFPRSLLYDPTWSHCEAAVLLFLFHTLENLGYKLYSKSSSQAAGHTPPTDLAPQPDARGGSPKPQKAT